MLTHMIPDLDIKCANPVVMILHAALHPVILLLTYF